ncbi:MAG: choice-of-anchor D domain-containing protein [Deltaproteobacteria bacterium]|nr:choice-of-anchor D domain-containing protein [Deltaproteobacteria bacterium]
MSHPCPSTQLDYHVQNAQGLLRRTGWMLLAASLTFLGGCQGCDPDLNVVAPLIAVDACTEATLKNSDGDNLGGAEGCSIDFGDKDISVRHTKEVRVSNPTNVELLITDIYFDDASDPSFRIDGFPEKIGVGLTSIVVVSWRPLLESSVNATLIISSNAQNVRPPDSPDTDPGPWDLEIPVVGNGVDNGVPDISITPEECDFGRVAKDAVAQCTLKVENLGNRPLVLESVIFDGEALTIPEGSVLEPFGFFGRAPGENDQIPAAGDEGNSATISIRFSPDSLGGYYGNLKIITNDPDEHELEVPLSGIGVNPPDCQVSIKSINGITGSNEIEPLDDVVLTAGDSSPSVAGGSIDSVLWEFIERPSGSTLNFTAPEGTETQFSFAGGILGVDLAGRYRVRATVTDDLGTQSVNECEISFEAIPTDTILLQLSWDTSDGDMDLHFLRMNDSDGRFCASSYPGADLTESCTADSNAGDCYFANCRVDNFGDRPNWDNDTSTQEGDPSLDLDDTEGYGPENINIDLAVAGTYLVAVDNYSSDAPSVGNTVRLYLYGQLQAEFWRDLTASDWWEVAIIHWPGVDNGVPCIEDLGTPVIECPDFQ